MIYSSKTEGSVIQKRGGMKAGINENQVLYDMGIAIDGKSIFLHTNALLNKTAKWQKFCINCLLCKQGQNTAFKVIQNKIHELWLHLHESFVSCCKVKKGKRIWTQ